ncbi:MAG: ribonuclease D [Pyrinomonadaceae bacterium]|nr:ribonuclease D [Pyrinomonadaceae bacterium]
MLDFSIKLVSGPQELTSLVARLDSATALALDIETVNWWDRQVERVSLIQLAFRENRQLRVAVIDALAGLDLDQLRPRLELSTVTKAIHNAAYDAVRLARHFRIHTSPIHDTMLAARRGGEKRYSLQAQAQAHLGVQLDKSEQRSDWARRPLTIKQLRYSALDAVCTLLLYEDQIARGLSASYQLRERVQSPQTSLALSDASDPAPAGLVDIPNAASEASVAEGLRAHVIALLGVVTELTGRYSPDRLAISAGSERVGLAGWIIDQALGPETDVDEESAKLGIAELCERGLVRLNAARRLEATESGVRLWGQHKPG